MANVKNPRKSTKKTEKQNVKAEHVEAEHVEAEHVEAEHVEAEHVEAEHVEAEHVEAEHVEAEHVEAEHNEAEHNEAEHVEAEHVEAEHNEEQPKIPKKRGRKPKGGKIIQNNFSLETNKSHEPNIIMHLKCGESDLVQNSFITSNAYEPNISQVETFQFETKPNELCYSVIDYGGKECGVKDYTAKTDYNEIHPELKEPKHTDNDDMSHIWSKIKELTYQLHTNSISDKKSACFWCTCDFDNPTILIPKFELNKMYHCYGCFCSPECATAYLFEEAIDTSTRFERYHLLNHIYCKIYNYEKNIKPAPNPFYTLNKYYGNLSIQEYRKLLKNERLLLVVDKPLSRILPELHEDNDDYMFNGATISTSNKFKLRRKTKQTKTDILTDTFNMGAKP